jgi:hypothetical protein
MSSLAASADSQPNPSSLDDVVTLLRDELDAMTTSLRKDSARKPEHAAVFVPLIFRHGISRAAEEAVFHGGGNVYGFINS